MTPIATRLAQLPKMPPEPEWHDKSWWYKGGKYYKIEAFNEWNDDRSAALLSRLALALETLELVLNEGYVERESYWEIDHNVLNEARAVLDALKDFR